MESPEWELWEGKALNQKGWWLISFKGWIIARFLKRQDAEEWAKTQEIEL